MIRLLVISWLIVANAAGTFVGLLIASYKGGFGFENLKVDVLKCVALAAIIVLLTLGIVALQKNADHPAAGYALAVVPVVWYVAVKMMWLDLGNAEVVLAGLASFCTSVIALYLALQFL